MLAMFLPLDGCGWEGSGLEFSVKEEAGWDFGRKGLEANVGLVWRKGLSILSKST
jgi:hypothetical protein